MKLPPKKWRFFRWANRRTISNSWPERSREYGWKLGPRTGHRFGDFHNKYFVDVIHMSFSEYIYIYYNIYIYIYYYIYLFIFSVIFKNRSMVIHHENISWKSTGDVDFDHPSLKVNILTQCHLKDWKQIHSAHVNPIADVVFRRCSNHVFKAVCLAIDRVAVRRCQFPLFGTASFGFGWPPRWGWGWPEWM